MVNTIVPEQDNQSPLKDTASAPLPVAENIKVIAPILPADQTESKP